MKATLNHDENIVFPQAIDKSKPEPANAESGTQGAKRQSIPSTPPLHDFQSWDQQTPLPIVMCAQI